MTRRELLLGLGVATVVTSCGGSPTSPAAVAPPAPPPTPAPDPAPPVLGVTRILSFGDSMTAGTVSPPLPTAALTAGLPVSYPYKLQELLTGRYSSQTITVLNAGKAGERASEGRSRFNDAVTEAHPEVVLLLDGANDLLALGESGVTATVNAMEDLVRDAVGRGTRAFVITLPPQRPGGRRASAAAVVPRYNDGLQQMAARKGARIIDAYPQLDLALIGDDGLHPTEPGYQRLAAIVANALALAFESAV